MEQEAHYWRDKYLELYQTQQVLRRELRDALVDNKRLETLLVKREKEELKAEDKKRNKPQTI